MPGLAEPVELRPPDPQLLGQLVGRCAGRGSGARPSLARSHGPRGVVDGGRRRDEPRAGDPPLAWCRSNASRRPCTVRSGSRSLIDRQLSTTSGVQPAGGHDHRRGAELGDQLRGDPRDQPVDQTGEAEHQARLQRLDGVLADRVRWARSARPSAAARPGWPAPRGSSRRPGASAPPRNCPSGPTASTLVEVPKSTTTTGRPLPSGRLPNSSCAASAVTTRSAPTSLGLSTCSGTPVRTPGPIRVHRDGEPVQQLAQRRQQTPGTVGAGRDPGDLGVPQQPAPQHAQLVGGGPGVRGDPPAVDPAVAVEGGQHGLGVADVHGEQHGSARPAGRGRGRGSARSG